ncbi:MAG: cytochrome c family protein [Planctomycetes bacterium]|nr:cytochrome c family protein [Planctomycetota bacterium]
MLLVRFSVAALAACFVGDSFHDLRKPEPVADGRIARLDAVERIDCTPCHRDVAEEWATSLHALAWVDELYQEELAEKKKPEGCWGCHVPAPLADHDLAQKPPPREEDRELGISCASCHVAADGSILGPWGAETDAHRSVKDERFAGSRADELCAACHRTNVGPVLGVAKDFETTDQKAKGRSCVGCHMQTLERPAANVRPGDPPREFPRRTVRSHALQTPRDPSFLARAFEISARRVGGRTLVDLENQSGHRVPGLIGRSLKFTAEVLDPQGTVLATAKAEVDFRSFVPVDETLTLELAATGPKVRLVGLHVDPRLTAPVEFLRREFTID